MTCSEDHASCSSGQEPGLRDLERGGGKVALERCALREGKHHFMKGSHEKGHLAESTVLMSCKSDEF